MLVNLPKKFPYGARAIWVKFRPKLYILLSHDSFSEDLYEVFWDDEAHFSHFSKKISFWGYMDPIRPKITQPYITLTALEIFRNSNMIWCNS